MTDNLRELIKNHDSCEFATDVGTRMHARLQRVVINGDDARGDTCLAQTIVGRPDIAFFFAPSAKTEIPVAGIINGRFVSRRIDRMLIDEDTKTIHILDYKTDISRDRMRKKYIAQLAEYRALIGRIYSGYNIRKYILWTHDWTLEEL